MSYLVDALKKAERERYMRQSEDIHALSAAGAGPMASASRAGPWLWLVAILVAANVALVIHVWRPGQPPSTTATTLPLPSFNQLMTWPLNFDGGAARGASEAAPSSPSTFRARREPAETPGQPAAIPLSASDRDTDRSGVAGPTANARPRDGSVYADTPLADGGARAEDNQRYGNGDTFDQSQRSGLPSIEINGQLYSTVPGRSFILVNGHRYHEGERLASGPAVESIAPDGATLRYRGQRYHVAGPR